MDSREWQEGFHRCSRMVQDYFLDPVSGENEDKAQQLLALDNDAWDRVSDPAWVLIFDGMNKQEFREEVKEAAGELNPDEVERILLQYLVYPVADMVAWDVDARLQELGVPASQLQAAFRISLRPMSYGAAARRIATNARLSVLTEEVARRLREILVSYLKDVRTLEQVKQALQQSQPEGGVGFSREQADRYVEELEKLQLAVQILSEQEYAEWYANFQREANSKLLEQPWPAKKQPASPTEPGISSTSTDAEALPVIRGSTTSNDYDGLLEAAVEETTQKLAVTGLDEYLLKRLRNIISTRLRDVRNSLQVKEVLVRDSKVGGLDRHAEEADAMVSVIEAAYQAHRGELMTAEQQRLETMKQAQDQKRDERRKEESAAHADWYKQKVQEANPWAAALEAQKAGGPPTQGPVTWPTPAPGVPGNNGVQPAAEAGTRPTVDSIRPPLRLTNLGTELAGITLAEFRRTARTPEEATERIWQKMETLRQESYERWQEGAQAWRQSPLQQQYLQIVAQSFTSGRPVAEIARELHEKDPNQPTAEEIGAILLINNRLHV